MRKTSGLIVRCSKCRAQFETRQWSGIKVCPECRPPKHCSHGVSTLDACIECLQMTRSRFLRVGVR